MRTTCLISNFNYARFLAEAIDGALCQSHAFDEIIVVDDGSTDGSLEMLKARYGCHSSIQIVDQPNRGQLACFNAGFARATGEIVFFLDADDIFEPHYVERALEVYDRGPGCDFLFCGRRLFGQKEGLHLAFPEDRDLGYSVIRTAYSREWIGAATSCLSMRHHVLEKILPLPFIDEWRTRADDCLVFGASLAGAQKRFLAQPLVRYRVHDANHYQGRQADPLTTYRRRLAVNRLFEYLERELCYNFRHLADLSHREYQTIGDPTLGQLVKYARISLAADVSIVRRFGCVAEMLRHYVGSAWHGVRRAENEAAHAARDQATSPLRLVAPEEETSSVEVTLGSHQRLRAA
jgi:glycosyltransferase involved in cell wall biosynthesis